MLAVIGFAQFNSYMPRDRAVDVRFIRVKYRDNRFDIARLIIINYHYYRRRIFDFDDWNDHAVANFRPYLTEDAIDSSISVSWDQPTAIDLDNLGGRLVETLSLYPREKPYIVRADITIMPEATLNIYPDVVMEFAPNIGILALGTLRAIGARGHEIIMRPLSVDESNTNVIAKRSLNNVPQVETIRLCMEGNCTASTNEGTTYPYNDHCSYLYSVPVPH